MIDGKKEMPKERFVPFRCLQMTRVNPDPKGVQERFLRVCSGKVLICYHQPDRIKDKYSEDYV
jgi:hypothetical protein